MAVAAHRNAPRCVAAMQPAAPRTLSYFIACSACRAAAQGVASGQSSTPVDGLSAMAACLRRAAALPTPPACHLHGKPVTRPMFACPRFCGVCYPCCCARLAAVRPRRAALHDDTSTTCSPNRCQGGWAAAAAAPAVAAPAVASPLPPPCSRRCGWKLCGSGGRRRCMVRQRYTPAPAGWGCTSASQQRERGQCLRPRLCR